MLTFASANVPLTAQEDKDFNYFDKLLHQNTCRLESQQVQEGGKGHY